MFNRISIVIHCLSKLKLNYRKMSSNIIRIGVCQLNSRDDKNENFQIGEELINKAKKEQAKVSFKKIDFILIIIIK